MCGGERFRQGGQSLDGLSKDILKRGECAMLGKGCCRRWNWQVLSPEEGRCLAWGSVAGEEGSGGELWEMKSDFGSELLFDSWLLSPSHGFSFVTRRRKEEVKC